MAEENSKQAVEKSEQESPKRKRLGATERPTESSAKRRKGPKAAEKVSKTTEKTDSPSDGADQQKRKKANFDNYNSYIRKIAADRYPDMAFTSPTIRALNSLIMDVQHRLCRTSMTLVQYKEIHTIDSEEIENAAIILFPRSISGKLVEAGNLAKKQFKASEL
jgi:hypothetical protein